jgi:membrane protein required for beta-lactamase induction
MLIIIIVLIFEYFYDDIKKFRQNDIILKSYHLFKNSLGKSDYLVSKIHLTFVLFVLLIGMIILTISSYISSLLYFVISLFILLYTLRTNQYNKDIEEIKIKLEFKKDNIDKNLLFNICPNLKQTRVKSNLNSLVIKNLFFNSIRNTFSILFLFIILGAPAAIAYKVLDCMIYSEEFKITAKVKQELKKYLYYIDYIPIRLTSYTFSVVSNYDQVINKINNLKLSNNQYLSNIEFINQTGESVYDETAKESDQIVQIQNILSRTLIAWLGIIMLLAVTGIFI